MDEPLLNTVVTGRRVQEWLSEYFGYPLEIQACQAEKIGDRQGFTSTIGRVLLEYKERDNAAKDGDNLDKNGDDLTKNGHNLAKNGDNLAKNGDKFAENGDNPAKYGDHFAKNGHQWKLNNGTDPLPKNGTDFSHKSDYDPLPKSVIFKTLNSAEMTSTLQKLSGADGEVSLDPFIHMHGTECRTYQILSPHRPVPIPTVYKAIDYNGDVEGAILMEDLSGPDNVICDAPGDMTLEQLYLVAEALADLHSWCWKNEQLWKGKIQSTSEFRIGFSILTSTMKNNIPKMRINYPGVFDSLDFDQAVHYVSEGHHSSQLRKLHQGIYPDVIVHGDFYGPNFIFKRLQNGKKDMSMKLIGVVDWALSHEGCGMEDLARLMTLSVDTQTRRKHTKDILEHYYKNLVKKVGAENMKASFDDIVHVYNVHFVLAGISYIFLLDWLQSLFVSGSGEKGTRGKEKIFDRCVGVYEDFLPLWNEIQLTVS